MYQWIAAIVVAFLICMVVGPLAIPILQKLKFGQVIRSEGPQWHMKKTGTPTMGGIIILLGAMLSCLIFTGYASPEMAGAWLAIGGFGLIGLLDDFIKVVLKRNLGLKAWQKAGLQLIVSVALSLYIIQHVGTSIRIPFTTLEWDLGWWYLPVLVFIMIATTNSVNLTDGLDGLAGGVSLVYFVFFTLLLFAFPELGSEPLLILSASLVGACLGFLRFNVYPARVFMGDFGSLLLGGAVVYLATATKLTLWLPVMGGMFMLSTISVILQVGSYKLRKKRIFKMAPLHHHFELMGLPETRIVSMYMIVTTILCLIGVLAVAAV